jgi:flagellar hook-associated protein 2
MVEVNKESPLYKINFTRDVGRFAIDLKEKSRSIQNMIAALSDSDEGIGNVFSKKIAQSSDEDVVSAEYIGSAEDAESMSPFDIQVETLASPQINLGNYIDPDLSDLAPGTYSFNLNTTLNSYEFQYTVNASDTNRDVVKRVMRLINNAGVGLKAELVSNEDDAITLQVASQQTGLSENDKYQFELLPTPDSSSIRAMHVLGLDQVEQPAQNASFLLNGEEKSASSNTFTINKAFELTLKQPNEEGETTSIGFKANADAIADNVQGLVAVYNNIIKLGYDYAGTQHSKQLLSDMESVAHSYHNELEAIGLNEEEDGTIRIDRSLLTDAVTAEDADDCFSLLNDFKDALNVKASTVSIDPMRYVSKIMVAYKNPAGHNFNAPYANSMYAGIMLDTFC